ncbi:hypothetical protein ABZP36_008091 [Zizania latifolia]
MGNRFTKTHEIPITSGTMQRPATTAERENTSSRPTFPRNEATSRRPTFPRNEDTSYRPPGPASSTGTLSLGTSDGEVGPVLQRPMVDVRSLFQLDRKLGSGQFGTTYLCTERATGLRYACKSVSKRKLVRPTDVEDTSREITILQHLSGQPNIVEFKGAYEDTESVNLVMEFCSGGDLFDRITAKGTYSESQAAAVCRDILTIVQVCHSMGVIHRDLRPENFLLTSNDDDAPLKVINFGRSFFFKECQNHHKQATLLFFLIP